MNCLICEEKINRSIKCDKCDKVACVKCYKKYCLMSIDEPKCIHCETEFDYEYILKYFGKTFVWGELKKHRENMLLDKILARMTEFTHKAYLILKIRKYNKKYNIIMKKTDDLCTPETYTKYLCTIMLLNQIKERIKKMKIKLEKKQKNEDKFVNMQKCMNEHCVGFLNKKNKCDICGVEKCLTCLERKENDHVCDQSIIDSVKEINNLIKNGETKNCPKCNILISRTKGCSQMWCVNCHCFFEWTTKKLINNTEFFHNPHYFEWLDNQKKSDNKTYTKNTNVQRRINDIQIFLNEIRDNLNNFINPLEYQIEKICLDYLIDHHDKNKLKILAQKYYKLSKKNEIVNKKRREYVRYVENIVNVDMSKCETDVELLSLIDVVSKETLKKTYEINNICKLFNMKYEGLTNNHNSFITYEYFYNTYYKKAERAYGKNKTYYPYQFEYHQYKFIWDNLTCQTNFEDFEIYIKNNKLKKERLSEFIDEYNESKQF
jgi:hypothetical protein